ncbi:hypothetical protein [Pseudacidovorax sp. RU35E]|uniref:hypothetical protein n=1 Tax=Pseudacidovorax sp. RU35E TaxID=1907403 RepID=UPI0009560A94|nr:hypothetical protein [Pseudacidovorax sp. RU35E]SIR06961.1 hypothetical protein SAMN05880557_107307 [Pseudacidovorax sp. RU35E]
MQFLTKIPTFDSPVALAEPPLDMDAAWSGFFSGAGTLDQSVIHGPAPVYYGSNSPPVFEDFGARLTGADAVSTEAPVTTPAYSLCTVFNSDSPAAVYASIRLALATWDGSGGWCGLAINSSGQFFVGVRTGDTTDANVDTGISARVGQDTFAGLVVSGQAITLYVGEEGRLKKYFLTAPAPQIAPRWPFKVNGLSAPSDGTFITRCADVYQGAQPESKILDRYLKWRLFFLDNLITVI